jgi:hypothetical protein
MIKSELLTGAATLNQMTIMGKPHVGCVHRLPLHTSGLPSIL